MTSLRALAGGARAQSLPLVVAICIAGCDGADRLTRNSEDLPQPPAAVPAPSFNGSFAGGIPFGAFALPTHKFGTPFNGGLRVIWPKYLLKELAQIKARGGKVVLSLTGPEHYYQDKHRHFSLSRWKELVDEYRKVDFSSYIEDGTIIGHYLIDEPNDAFNWNGKLVPGSVIEQMAAYSKQFWPGMATIVRVDPDYLKPWAPYRALDAAWAQYVTRKGTPQDYIRRNIADAKEMGLALVTGLNIKKGERGAKPMTAALIKSAGRTILEESYPCAFISWQYDEKLLGRPDVRAAMQTLASRARARSSKSCHRGGREVPPPPDEGEDDDDDDEGENEKPPSGPDSRGIRLTHTSFRQNGRQFLRLNWTGAAGATVDVYREGSFYESTKNDGQYVRAPHRRRSTKYEYRVCQRGTRICSNSVTVPIPGTGS
jgi:hypothetical protein